MRRRPPPTATRVPSLTDLRGEILAVTRKHRARDVRIFGSFARSEQTPDSDIDVLVRLPRKATLIDQARLLTELERTLGRKVDLLTYGGISRFLRRRILTEARPL